MDAQIPTEFIEFLALADRLRKYAPTQVQVNSQTWRKLQAIVTDPRSPWTYQDSLPPIFGIPLAGVEIVDEVPDGIIRMPEIQEGNDGRSDSI